MAQYIICEEAYERIYASGDIKFRENVHDGVFCIDQVLTETGFDGDEDVDWRNRDQYKSEHVTAQGIFRQGVRDDSWVYDEALTETGFDGDEDTDWENIGTIKHET